MSMSDLKTVTKLQRHSEGIFEISFEKGDLEFVPGDCVALYGEDHEMSRPYSIASGVNDSELSFIIREMEGGEVSPFLASRSVGDQVKISPPFGWFRPGAPEKGASYVFFATGTGISPFMAHFKTRKNAAPATLFYGVRELADAVYLDPIKESGSLLRLALSRKAEKGAHHGRITDLLDEIPISAETHYYLCGLDAMIDEISIYLESKNIALPHIHRECFFNADYD